MLAVRVKYTVLNKKRIWKRVICDTPYARCYIVNSLHIQQFQKKLWLDHWITPLPWGAPLIGTVVMFHGQVNNGFGVLLLTRGRLWHDWRPREAWYILYNWWEDEDQFRGRRIDHTKLKTGGRGILHLQLYRIRGPIHSTWCHQWYA